MRKGSYLASFLLVDEQARGGEGCPGGGGAEGSGSVLALGAQPPSQPQPPTYLLIREAKGCTCKEVPMTRRRSTFRKSCGEGRELGSLCPGCATAPSPAPSSKSPFRPTQLGRFPKAGPRLPHGAQHSGGSGWGCGEGRGPLTDCIQEKKRAGRLSPKNTISEAETDGRTETVTWGGREDRWEQGQTWRLRWELGAVRTGQGHKPNSPHDGSGAPFRETEVAGCVGVWPLGRGRGRRGPPPKSTRAAAHQASPGSDSPHTWASPQRRSSLGAGKGKREKVVRGSGVESGGAAPHPSSTVNMNTPLSLSLGV